jgi:hypothetical protein
VLSKKKVTGKVRVTIDGKVYGSVALKNGRAVLKLPKLKVGKHRIRAGFVGTKLLKGSRSKVVTIKVVRKRR